MGASNLVNEKVPPITSDQIQEMLEHILPQAAAYGITTADDTAVTPEVINAFSDIEDEGNLPVRVFGEIVAVPELGELEIPAMAGLRNMYGPDNSENISNGYHVDIINAISGITEEDVPISSISAYFNRSGLFNLQTGKLFLDGMVEGHTGYLLMPYADYSFTNGTINWDPETFNQMVEDLDSLGFQVDIHAIGDGAVRMSLDAYGNARKKNGIRDSRYKISHIQLNYPADIPRLSSEGVIAALQPK